MYEIYADLHVHIGRSENGKPIKITAARSLNFANIAKECADRKGITPAQISLAWMLKKYPHVVPIPGMRKDERVIENLGAAEVELSDEEFKNIDTELNKITIYGNRTDEDIHKLGTVDAIGYKGEIIDDK